MKTSIEGKITIENVNDYREENNLTLYETIDDILKKTGIEYPKKPIKVYLEYVHTSNQAREYAIALKEYENLLHEYSNKKEEYNEMINHRYSIIEQLIKKESGFFDIVPEKYQNKVYNLAYADSHSGGYYDVYQKLNELVNIFE